VIVERRKDVCGTWADACRNSQSFGTEVMKRQRTRSMSKFVVRMQLLEAAVLTRERGCDPLSPDDVAEVVVFACSRRENVVVADSLLYPTYQVSRDEVLMNTANIIGIIPRYPSPSIACSIHQNFGNARAVGSPIRQQPKHLWVPSPSHVHDYAAQICMCI